MTVWITACSFGRAVDPHRYGVEGSESTPSAPTRSATGCSHGDTGSKVWARGGVWAWIGVEMWIGRPGSRQELPVATVRVVHTVETNVENGPGCSRSSTRTPRPLVVHAIHRPTTSPTLFKETLEIQRRVDEAGKAHGTPDVRGTPRCTTDVTGCHSGEISSRSECSDRFGHLDTPLRILVVSRYELRFPWLRRSRPPAVSLARLVFVDETPSGDRQQRRGVVPLRRRPPLRVADGRGPSFCPG